DTLGAVLLRIDRFVDERCMPRKIRTFEWALRIRFLWFVAQNNDDFSICADTLIIVVMQLRSGNTVADEHEWTIETCRVRKGDRYEIFIDFELVPVKLQIVVWSEDSACCQLKFLKIGVVIAHWTKSQNPKLRSNVIRRLVQFG